MVSSKQESLTQEVWAKVLSEGDDREDLSLGDTVSSLRLTGIHNHMFSPIITKRGEHCTNPSVAGICVKNKRLGCIRLSSCQPVT